MVILNTNKNIILGSKSPRRIDLIKSMGFRFQVKILENIHNYINIFTIMFSGY